MDSVIVAGALGGVISGALLLLIVTLCALCWTRKSKMKNLDCDQPQQEQIHEEIANKNDHEFELKGNEALGSTTHYILTEDNVAYGQTTLQISTEDNVAYGQIMHPH